MVNLSGKHKFRKIWYQLTIVISFFLSSVFLKNIFCERSHDRDTGTPGLIQVSLFPHAVLQLLMKAVWGKVQIKRNCSTTNRLYLMWKGNMARGALWFLLPFVNTHTLPRFRMQTLGGEVGSNTLLFSIVLKVYRAWGGKMLRTNSS